MTVNFYLYDVKSKKDTLILLHVRHKGKLVTFSTKQKINPSKWNYKKKRAKIPKDKPSKRFESLNQLLNNIEDEVYSFFHERFKTDLSVSTSDLKHHLIKTFFSENNPLKLPQNSVFDFIEYFDLFISESDNGIRLQKNGKRLSEKSIEHYRLTRSHLLKFIRLKKFDLKLTSLSGKSDEEVHNIKSYWKDFYLKFSSYLYDDVQLYDNSAGIIIAVVKTFMRYCINEKNLNIGDAYKQFHTYRHRIPVVALDPQQLKQLIFDKEKLATLPENLKVARDIFIFGCTTGLRKSDIFSIKETDFSEKNGSLYLDNTSKKTQTRVNILLPDYCVEIVNKYKNDKRDTLFPVIDLTFFNKKLKAMAKHYGWNKTIVKTRNRRGQPVTIYKDDSSHYTFADVISSHTMRKTCITTNLKLGMPEFAVKRLSGHAPDSRSFYRYIEVSQEYVNEKSVEVYEKLKN